MEEGLLSLKLAETDDGGTKSEWAGGLFDSSAVVFFGLGNTATNFTWLVSVFFGLPYGFLSRQPSWFYPLVHHMGHDDLSSRINLVVLDCLIL